MAVILQIDFTMSADMLGDRLVNSAIELANSITKEHGFIAKIWTENKATSEAGGIYLFKNRESAQNYLDMHQQRVEKMGASNINYKIFEINEALTNITKGPLNWD
ncbi:monooxygenase [Entomomonas asaccharolytica]|uniref:Monooxygenase n=1 Tax=Entomomonas asaccharolytica TaxID=2785331 RepID=A0A974NHJ4_9GAMM|nr:monooxygenase [Entomomonas asaccharolytica]QQP86507.1 monooxygenase [Entomomonas asaccharolytica]